MLYIDFYINYIHIYMATKNITDELTIYCGRVSLLFLLLYAALYTDSVTKVVG